MVNFYSVVRATLIEMGVEKPFWPSSPSNGPLVDDKARGIYVLRWGNVQDPAFGDVHFYDYTSVILSIV